MSNYYSDRLNANKLQRCYEVAPTRVRQFLEEEIAFVLSKIHQNDLILDLGCGYGRVSIRLLEGMKSEWLIPKGADSGKVILYVHGGGYVSGSCSDHRGFISKTLIVSMLIISVFQVILTVKQMI